MNTTPQTAGQPGAVPSRRVLLRTGGLVVLTGFGVAVPALRSQAATRNPVQAEVRQPTYYIHDGPKRVALTIDDGPSPVYTPQILRLLHRYRIIAAFSMIGVNVQANPGVAREVAHAGHMIVNHTWSHPDLALMSSTAVRDEMIRGTDAIYRATGRLRTCSARRMERGRRPCWDGANGCG